MVVARYRAVKRCFVGGQLRDPGEEFDGPAGLTGAAIEAIGGAGSPDGPAGEKPRKTRPGDAPAR